MKSVLVSMVAVALMTTAPQQARAAGTKTNEREWISQKGIAARNGYRLPMGKLGTYVMKNVRPVDATHSRCLVHVPSVKSLLAKGISEGTLRFSTGSAVRVELKVTTCPKGISSAGVLQDTDGSDDGGDNGGQDNGSSGGEDDEEEELCCKGGGKGCVADIERLP